MAGKAASEIESAIRTKLAATFRERGELFMGVWLAGSPVWTELGWFRDGADLKIGVRVWTQGGNRTIRQRVLAIADGVPFRVTFWVRAYSDR